MEEDMNEMELEEDPLAYRYDTQLLIDGENLDKNQITRGIQQSIAGNCLLVVGEPDMIKIHFHTNEPWKLLEYCSKLGEMYDIVIEDMNRQTRGLDG